MKQRISFLLTLVVVTALFLSGKGKTDLVINEEFRSLNNWETLYFSKKHTNYSTDSVGTGMLRAESNASATGLLHNTQFNVYTHPELNWRWKVENTYAKADMTRKSGDDYPMTIFVIFPFVKEEMSLADKVAAYLGKLATGLDLPHSSLNYVWSSNGQLGQVLPNSNYAGSRIIVKQAGKDKCGQWLMEQVNIVEDYRKAFGTEPPANAIIGFMNDSDNTGEHSVSYLDYIRVCGS